MQVIERNCPNCSTPLRLRGPLRDVQEFACPDCGTELLARTRGDDTQIIAKDQPRAKPVTSGSSQLPKIAAFATAGVLLAGFVGYLLSGESESTGNSQKSKPAIEKPVVVVAQPQPKIDGPLINEGTIPESPETIDPKQEEPIDVPMVQSDDASDISDIVEPGNEDAAIPDPEPPKSAEPTAEELEAARKVAAIAVIEARLGLQLLAYSTGEDTKLGAFLREMSELSASAFRSPLTKTQNQTPVKLEMKSCTVAQVLAAGLEPAGLRYEVREDGIHLLSK